MTESTSRGPRLRTVMFADSGLAQPAMEALVHGGWLVGLCTSRRPAISANLRDLAPRANIPVYEADRISLSHGVETWLRDLRPDVLLTFTFPYRLPPTLLNLARLGGFNVHGGRLPEYRGPQPVFWQILNCEPEGAVTIHRMDAELDHGAIVVSRSVPIGPEDTYGMHVSRLAFAAVTAIEALCGGLLQYDVNLPALPQDESRAAFQRRPAIDDLMIRWDEQSGDRIRGLVKAGNPWNQGAFATVRGINLRLTDVTLKPAGGSTAAAAGTILIADPTRGILVNCRDGSALQLDVISMDEGILPGRVLAVYGIQAGEPFVTPARAQPASAATAG